MRSKKPEAPVEPWYRQGWPWFLIALPATAVVAGIVTLVIAAKTFDGMVVDDYYKEGRAIVQTIGRVEHARELGLRAALRTVHGEIFDPAWWRDVQARLAAGEHFDVPPYPASALLAQA